MKGTFFKSRVPLVPDRLDVDPLPLADLEENRHHDTRKNYTTYNFYVITKALTRAYFGHFFGQSTQQDSAVLEFFCYFALFSPHISLELFNDFVCIFQAFFLVNIENTNVRSFQIPNM